MYWEWLKSEGLLQVQNGECQPHTFPSSSRIIPALGIYTPRQTLVYPLHKPKKRNLKLKRHQKFSYVGAPGLKNVSTKTCQYGSWTTNSPHRALASSPLPGEKTSLGKKKASNSWHLGVLSDYPPKVKSTNQQPTQPLTKKSTLHTELSICFWSSSSYKWTSDV